MSNRLQGTTHQNWFSQIYSHSVLCFWAKSYKTTEGYSPHVSIHNCLVIGSSSMAVVENGGVVAAIKKQKTTTTTCEFKNTEKHILMNIFQHSIKMIPVFTHFVIVL